MQISKVEIKNFRGIQSAEIYLTKYSVLLGDNNTGKTTVLEALDLVLGPDRLSRSTVVDEHDFYLGKYLVDTGPDNPENAEVVVTQPAPPEDPQAKTEAELITIEINVTIINLSFDQIARFGAHIEFWDTATNTISVSYTHLDVYKRQVLYSANEKSRFTKIEAIYFGKP